MFPPRSFTRREAVGPAAKSSGIIQNQYREASGKTIAPLGGFLLPALLQCKNATPERRV
jgi:hypothetical protein